MDFNTFLGSRIANLRISKGITQKQLGEFVGLSKQAINDIEKGRRGTLVVKALLIAKALDTTIEDLTDGFDNFDADL